jgi:6-pyruvoyl-tetrahydropterin synthase
MAEQPTAERIAKYIAEQIERYTNNSSITEITVTVYEATNQYVTYTYNLEGE